MGAMDEAPNPYATPKAAIAAPDGAPFFATPTGKLAALSVVTFSLYTVVWSYHSWKALRARFGKPIWPFWRAVFAPLWMYGLCDELNREAREAAVATQVAAGGLAVAYFVLNALWRLPGAWSLFSLLSFLPLLPANALARGLNERLAPDAPPEVGWTPWNLVALAAFGPLLVLALIGMFLPPEP